MAQQTINIGASPNDGTGTPLRTAFQYTNSNFSELYTAVGPSGNNIVVPGSATITGDLTVDTSTLKVDSANNRVGIGTASPSFPLHVQSATAVFKLESSTGTNPAYLYATSTGGDFYFGRDNSTGTTFGTGTGYSAVLYSANAYPMVFFTNAIERYRIASDGVATWSNVGGVAGTAMTLNANGLGIGVTPSAWASNYKSVQTLLGAALAGKVDGLVIAQNCYYDGTNWVNNRASTFSSRYDMNVAGNGFHAWYVYNASFGTVGNTIPFTQAMTLDGSGNLLVGTTSQASGVTLSRATIKSTSADWTSVIWNSNAIPYGFRIQHDTDSNGTGNEFLYCLGAANLRASIRSNGGIANYQANDVSLSDSRMKSDIKPLGSYWNKIKSLEIVTFKYKDQTHNDDNIGLIAQQVESVAPEFVDVDGFGNTPADGVPLKTIYTTDLYHAAIKALQEAMTRIEALESKLA